MIDAIEYARTNKVPLLGICLGMQLITIEYARNVCDIKDANSLEFDELCKNPVINLMSDQSLEDMGGTQRLGDYECQLNPGTHAYRLYGKEQTVNMGIDEFVNHVLEDIKEKKLVRD